MELQHPHSEPMERRSVAIRLKYLAEPNRIDRQQDEMETEHWRKPSKQAVAEKCHVADERKDAQKPHVLVTNVRNTMVDAQ
jgi:hypothetical protein